MNIRTILASTLLAIGLLAVALPGAGATPPPATPSAPAIPDDGSPRLGAQLIWGTNGDKPADKDFKPISAELKKRLRRIFKWQNYFEINRKEFNTPEGKTSRVEMSPECRLEVANLARDEFEIQLFGKGVLVVTKRQHIQPGETVVLGGDDKNDDAWFVILGFPLRGAPRK